MLVTDRPDQVDLLVVGAGPAGTAAAVTARRLGLTVTVIDKAVFPRDKTCGDGLTTAALRALARLGFPLATLDGIAAPVGEVVLVSPSGRRVEVSLPAAGRHAAVVPRRELDARLVEHARTFGATVLEGQALAGLRDDEHTADVIAELAGATTIRAHWIIAADGHFSPTRKLVDGPAAPRLGEWSAFRQYFTGVDDPRLWVLFEEDLLPGYAWVFPLPGGRANVGFGVLRRPGVGGRAIRALWDSLLDRPAVRAALGPRARPVGPHRAWPIPTAYDPEALAAGRVLFVGDAASVVDPMTGEGIAQALETGMLAAEAVAAGGNVSERYRRSVERTLGRDLRFAARLQTVLASPLGARLAIRAAGLTPWTRRNFARWMFEDYPRALVLTPDRWRLPLPVRFPVGGQRRS